MIILRLAAIDLEESPAIVLNVFAVKNNANALAELRPSIGANVYSSQSFQVELAEDAEVQAQLKIGNREQLSPVYVP